MTDKTIPPNSIRPVTPPPASKSSQVETPKSGFQELLDQEVSRLKFSKHAQERMNHRQIQVDSKDLKRLGEAVKMAAEKGGKESLVIMDDVAYVVSIKNNTVITAVDGGNMKNNVFTNIDTAVILD